MTVSIISSLVLTLIIRTLLGIIVDPRPQIIVTLTPSLFASSAIAVPSLPEAGLVITLIGSMYSIVAPAVIRTFFLFSFELP